MKSIVIIHEIVEKFGGEKKVELMASLLNLRRKSKMEYRKELSDDLTHLQIKLNYLALKRLKKKEL